MTRRILRWRGVVKDSLLVTSSVGALLYLLFTYYALPGEQKAQAQEIIKINQTLREHHDTDMTLKATIECLSTKLDGVNTRLEDIKIILAEGSNHGSR